MCSFGINTEFVAKRFHPATLRRQALRVANRYLFGYFDCAFAPSPEEPLQHPPIFFLGAPRSGSTLAVQVITESLDVGYISNRHCQWFGAPAWAERLLRPTRNRPSSDYRSRQGMTDGWYAPAECGAWWYRFFRRKPSYVRLDDAKNYKMQAFRSSVASLTNAFDRPIVFKNLYASMRIQSIARYLPESLFIVIRRNEVDNGHSLLEARHSRFDTYQCWFSVEPPEIARLRTLPPHEQVIEQIRSIYKVIDHDLMASNVALSRRFDLVYEELCEDPASVVGFVQAFMARNGCDVARRKVNIPSSFARRDGVGIDRMLYQALCEYSGARAVKGQGRNEKKQERFRG